MENLHPVKFTAFKKLLLKLCAVDEEILRQCPARDHGNAFAIGEIQLCFFVYTTGLFCGVAHKLGAPDHFRPDLLLASSFLALNLTLQDSFLFLRSGWYANGLELLKAAGVTISNGLAAQVRAIFAFLVRVILSVGLALLSGILAGLILFSPDIMSRILGDWRQANAHLVVAASEGVDGEIRRATDAVNTQGARVAALATQVEALRQNEIDPSSGYSSSAQQEVRQLLEQKTKADEELRAAEKFGAAELAGLKVTSENSGVVGNGPKRRAAMEQVANARGHAQETTRALDAARARLDKLRNQQGAPSEAVRQQAHDQLPAFEKKLTEENARWLALKGELTRLTENRGDAIRAAIEKAPNHVPLDNGLLAQLRTLDQIASANPRIAAMIILVEVVCFTFDLAAMLARGASTPTTYAVLLVKQTYVSAVHIADEVVSELNPKPPAEAPAPQIIIPVRPANDNFRMHEQAVGQNPFDGHDDPPPTPPMKRKRGRPRKTPPAVV